MGLLRSLAMLSLLTLILWLPRFNAQSTNSALALDALLQDYAYRAFVLPRTGIPYDGIVPSNLTGIKIAAMRLRSGSLKSRGVRMYKEFGIPEGVVVRPYVERVVLVYQNLGNWSGRYYPLPGYTYIAPVLGLLAYDASNLSATNLRELDINASGNPLNITFLNVRSAPDGSIAKCVWFDSQGFPSLSNVTSGNVCSTIQQGHFSIVVESLAPSPAPVSPTPSPPNVGTGPSGGGKKKNSKKVWPIIGSVLGGLLLLVLLSFLILWAQKLKQRKKVQQMERAAEVGESLQMTMVGETKAPAAMVTRTQPTLENEYVP
uniref:Malectin-like domain-containing protein n=1 Tax=Populus davidiana TaxID=266767 RepID=A0A6M2EGV5_9ROSI